MKDKNVFILCFLIPMLLLAACAGSPASGANPLPNTGNVQAPAAAATRIPFNLSQDTPTATASAAATESPTSSPTQPPADTPTQSPTLAPTTALAVTGVDSGVNLSSIDQASYNGICQVTLTFEANISTNGAGTVTYYWLRSDGSSSPVRTLTYTTAGFQSVSDTWTASAPNAMVNAWDRVFIDQPNHQAFSPASFNLVCNPSLPKQRPPHFLKPPANSVVPTPVAPAPPAPTTQAGK